jgi:DNA-binding transcriptional ArsR family regulator
MYAVKEPEAPTERQLRVAADVLQLLGDRTRLKILWALAMRREESVGELAAATGAQPAGVSQHLGKLRLAGLVTTRRDGTKIYYSLVDSHLRSLVREALHYADHRLKSLSDHE